MLYRILTLEKIYIQLIIICFRLMQQQFSTPKISCPIQQVLFHTIQRAKSFFNTETHATQIEMIGAGKE
jgi:hypothetical protein